MAETTKVELVYSGIQVDDGTIPIEDLLLALQGFSGAYEKIARDEAPDVSHQIRVAGIQKGSSKILVEIVELARDPAAITIVTAAGMMGAAAYTIIKDIAAVIKGKKALRGEPVTNNYTLTDKGITIKGDVNLTINQFGYLQSRELDNDLEKLTKPLEQGRGVDEFKIKRDAEELVKVDATERGFFREAQYTVTVRDGIWLEGRLNSHSKRTNRGMFYTTDGHHIRYRYVGQDLEPLLQAYAHDGMVRVLGRVMYQGEIPQSIEIRDIQPIGSETAGNQLSLENP